ncbi:MAG: BatA and WFA domain-containing protein [Bacteroidetes bacterium]|nr:BatA and WFA domain-containing protein [Bacteroidota bacterium]
MQFIYPGFLFALSALAIPIIIHLFNFRKFKRIYFTNVKFLREIKQETQSKSQLKHLLVLLARMLALAFLVFAFAQPFIPQTKTTQLSNEEAVSIFIDNSFSMDAQGKAGSLLEQAKKTAVEILAAYKPSDRFQLLTNDFEAKHQRLLTKEEFLESLQEIKSSARVKSVSEVLSRQADLLAASPTKSKCAYVISDFQKSNFSLSNVTPDTALKVRLIPIQSNSRNNLFIDSCWFETPSRQLNKPEVLTVRVTNVSDVAVENAPIKLFLNKKQKALASFSLDANTSAEVKLTFTCKEIGIQNAQVQLTDFPVTFDDSYYFSFEVAPKIHVLAINGLTENNSISTLFKNDSVFTLSNAFEKNIDYSSLQKNELIVLNELTTVSSGLSQELNKFVSKGGSLLVFPAIEMDLVSYQNFLSPLPANYFTGLDTARTRVDKINFAHPLYAGVFDKKRKPTANIDLPIVHQHYVLNKASHSNLEYLLKMQNGDVFIGKNKVVKGQVYVCSVPLDARFSNLTKHAMFVPTLYNIALYSVVPSQLFYTLGKDESVELPAAVLGTEEVYHLKSTSANFDIIPEHKTTQNGTSILLHNQVAVADNYLVLAGKDSVMGLGFNYDRKESNLECLSTEELETQLSKAEFSNFSLLSGTVKAFSNSLREMNQGKRYWKWCIVLALLFLAVEGALIRFWK